jgi:formylglycine-generating enzyme required for sulfatase activity
MKNYREKILHLVGTLVLSGFITPALAQEVSIPDPGLNAAIRETLGKPAGPLTQQDLLGLTNLSAISWNITNLQGLAAAHNLNTLFLDDNQLTDLSFPEGLTNLTSLSLLVLSGNPFTNLPLLDGLTNLTRLQVETGGLTNLTLPAGLTKLTELRLGFNHLPSLTLRAEMTNLSVLSLFNNQLTNLTLPPNLTSLSWLDLDGNQLSRLTLPPGLTQLGVLIVGDNQLTNFTVPADMTNLNFLRLNDNKLTSLTLPVDLNHLSQLVLSGNQLTSLTLPTGLTNLSALFIQNNQLTNLTLPPDLTKLTALFLDGNPLATLILSGPLAATSLAAEIAELQNQGVNVFTYPLKIQLVKPLPIAGAFKIGITGPPGFYGVFASTNLAIWAQVGVVSNPLGSINFVDTTSHVFSKRFYRVLPQTPPTNMVFISANTFIMGSPTNELHRDVDEGPQTTVTLTHGFWIGKYEVTQAEYFAVTGENPSGFPGDLSRPVESVSFFAASNYCRILTAQDQVSGRISPGSHYRLPTEAEWECAARAGASTRFYYGDDPDLTGLNNYAWFGALNGISTHPVGQKLPNAWGLYDMAGNVWEWCQDWYGTYPGGSVTDPQGPSSNPIGWKVIRGGAWESSEVDCRSASRGFEGASLFISDFIIGFRVVLDMEPQ